MNLKQHTFCMPEALRSQNYTIATYFCEVDAQVDIHDRAAALAIGQTIGTWTEVPGITSEALQHHMGRVLGVYEVPPAETSLDLHQSRRSYIIRLGFPEVNFGDQIPMLLTTLLGNDISTALPVKLLDIEISAQLSAALAGPQFGIAGLRKLTGVWDRPLILNVLKPCTGFPPQAAVERFADSARAGTDVIKDDELLADPSFNRLEARTRLIHTALQQVYEETGHRALYCANITDRADRLLINAHRAAELGADLVMINVPAAGFGCLQAVTADPAVKLPVLTHFAGFNSTTEAPRAGMTSPLFLGKLMRLAGADAVILPSPFSAYPLLQEHFYRAAQLLRLPLYDMLPAMPVPGGGIHPATAYQITRLLGKDCMIDVGGAIQGHPDGTAAGVQALQSAVQAACAGMALEEIARQTPALQRALTTWR